MLATCVAKHGESAAIERMKKCEDSLFGSPDAGQSPMVMKLDAQKPSKIPESRTSLTDSKGNIVGLGTRYLGYGVLDAAGKLNRPCLTPPLEFVLRISAKDELCLDRITPALHLLGLSGGLGARARKGFGSLNLISLQGDGIEDWHEPKTIQDYRCKLTSLLNDAMNCNSEPEFSAFSSHSRIDLLRFESNSATEVLDQYGCAMVRYRSWGRNGQVLKNEPSRCQFPDDHDWMKGKKVEPGFHPRRAMFGLPHNYGQNIGVKARSRNRRASPLFFHIHNISGKYVGISLLLRSQFLPKGEQIQLSNRRNRQHVSVKPDWSVLTDFIDENSKEKIWPND